MAPAGLADPLGRRSAEVNGIRMQYVEGGTGEVVVFLHGFPESWYCWHHQLAALAPRYRVVAPDLRGCGETERRGPYDTATLVQDVVGLIEALGGGPVHLVGHDWGGVLAWLTAIHQPQRVRTLTVCNAPHPALFARAVRRPRQFLRSLYILFFQVPWLPERALACRNYQALARAIIRDTKPGTFTRDDVRMMLSTWRAHGLGGGVSWYRALLRHRRRLPWPLPPVAAPTLVIWGEDDIALGKDLNDGLEAFVPELELHYLPNVSHWVQQEEPAIVTGLLLAFLARHAA